ncbi:MAG: hypothetical protein LBR08_00580 [Bacteroidales bacterium]|jgi:hypothetical protein|nr:hypothetical protein [Bacteroidales bacterium]
MYRKIFFPNEQNSHIPFTVPHEWYGKAVEVIAFPISSSDEKPQPSDDDFYKLCGAWDDDRSAEEMLADLKAARKFKESDWKL